MNRLESPPSRLSYIAVSLLLCAQLSGVGLTQVMAADSGAFFNTTLPLPEFNAAHVERVIRNAHRANAGKSANTSTDKTATRTATAAAAPTSRSTNNTVSFIISTPAEEPKAELRGAIPDGNTAAPISNAPVTPSGKAVDAAPGWLEDALDKKGVTADSAAPPAVSVAATPSSLTGTVSETTTRVEAGAATAEAAEDKPSAQASTQNATTGTGSSDHVLAMTFPSPAPTSSAEIGNAPIVVDNDESTEQETTLEFVPLITDEAGTKAKAGARFPVLIMSEITTKTAKEGDPVHGRLKFDLKIGNRLVAQKGSVVRGHVNYSLKARTQLASLVSVNRWYRTSGCLGIAFDEIINEKGEHIPVKAEPAKTARYVKNKAEGRELGINHKGQIAGPWSTQLKYKAVRIGLNAALSPLGPMTFGAMPLALGVLGAANPSFAFAKPVGTNVRHRRIKGFVWGALSGVPGSWLIEDTTIKGQEAVIKPGDEFYAEITQEFTGEPATDAEMLGGAQTKVKGEVVDIDGKGTKKLKK